MRLDAARRHEYAQLINDSGHHLLSVVNGILDMSKMETGDFEITPEPFAPAQVIGNCCDLLALQGARARASSWSMRLPDDLPEIVADKRALQADPAQSAVQRHQVHRSRRPGHGQRARVEGARHRWSRSRTPASASAPTICRASASRSSRRARAYDRRHDGTGLGLSIVQGPGGAARRRGRHREPAGRGHARHRPPAARLRDRASAGKPPERRRDPCRSTGGPNGAATSNASIKKTA